MKPAKNRKLVLENHVWSTSMSLFMPSSYVVAPPHLASATDNSSSTVKNYNHLKPITPNFDSSIALTILVLVTAIFFMGFFSVYLRCFAKDVATSTEEVAAFRRRNEQQRQQRQSSSSGEEASGYNQHGLDPTIVGSLPLVLAYIVTCGNADCQPVECVVCLSEFQDREMVKMIPYCEHVFHPECIDTWFLSHSSCPLCRSTKLFPSPKYNSNGNSVLLPVMNNKADGSSAILLNLTSESSFHDHVITLDDNSGGGHVGLVNQSLEKSTRVVEGDTTGADVAKVVIVEREVGLIRRTWSCSSLSVNGKRSSTIDQVLLHDHNQLQRSSSSRF